MVLKKYIVILLLLVYGTVNAQVLGCTDPLSSNYNPMATENDGSCEYNSASVTPVYSVDLPAEVVETSGLVKTPDGLLTHNDNTDVNLYLLDSISGSVVQAYPLTGTGNRDWEEIVQDNEYFYIGDFGNNVSGNRTDLNILKVSKQSLYAGVPEVSSIQFTYSDQTDFSPKSNNNTDFDCEAMVVSQDSIYLFTKQWVTRRTSVYKLPKEPGTYVAQLKTTHDVSGLITGATYLEDKRLLVLCGYNSFVTPFLYLLYDFNGYDFFSGNKRKLSTSGLGFHQIEGIATTDGLRFYATNEKFDQIPLINIAQQLHKFDLTAYLGDYIENISLKMPQNELRASIRIYPNPTRNIVYIETDASVSDAAYIFYDTNGRAVLNGVLKPGKNRIDTSDLASGIYTVKIDKFPSYSYRLLKN